MIAKSKGIIQHEFDYKWVKKLGTPTSDLRVINKL